MTLRWFWITITILLILVLLPYSWTLVFAFVTALLLERVVGFFGRSFKMNRLWSVLLSFLLYIGALSGIVYILVSVLIKQVINLSEKSPGLMRDLYYSALLPFIRKWESYSKTLPNEVITSVEDALERGLKSLEMFFQNLIEATVQLATLVPGFLIEFIIYMVSLFLFSLEMPKIKQKLSTYLSKSIYHKFSLVVNDLGQAAVGFLKAQVFLSLITFTMAYLGLWILDVPYTLLLSILIVIVDILPILGTGSVLVPWAVISVMQGNQSLGIGLIVLFAVITIVRRILEPKIFSANMGVSPLAALISLYLGFKVMGFIGLFLGPALVIVYETLKRAGVIRTKSLE